MQPRGETLAEVSVPGGKGTRDKARDGAGFIRAFPRQQDLGSRSCSFVLWCGFSDV